MIHTLLFASAFPLGNSRDLVSLPPYQNQNCSVQQGHYLDLYFVVVLVFFRPNDIQEVQMVPHSEPGKMSATGPLWTEGSQSHQQMFNQYRSR